MSPAQVSCLFCSTLLPQLSSVSFFSFWPYFFGITSEGYPGAREPFFGTPSTLPPLNPLRLPKPSFGQRAVRKKEVGNWCSAYALFRCTLLRRSHLRVLHVGPQERPEHLLVVGDLQVQQLLRDDHPCLLAGDPRPRRYRLRVCTIGEGTGVNRRAHFVGVSGKPPAVQR